MIYADRIAEEYAAARRPIFVDILNALRVGELKAKHLTIFMQKISKDMCGEFSIEKTLCIYPTNQDVTDCNQACLTSTRLTICKYSRSKFRIG